MSRVAVIGPGRVGTVLAVGLSRAGHRLVAVGGGGDASRRGVTRLLAGVRAEASPAQAARDAELVVLCVPDDVLEGVVTDLAVAGAVGDGQRVVHVAGALGLAPLRRAALAGARVAACHPAMTVPAGTTDPQALVGTAWAVTAGPHDVGWARDLVEDLGGDAHEVADIARVRYHAGLAVGSNAVGAAVALARQLLLSAGVREPAAFLAPLVTSSATNVLARGAAALTGPVVRGDVGTVARHLEELGGETPELADAYRRLSQVILAQIRPELGVAAAARLEALLEEEP